MRGVEHGNEVIRFDDQLVEAKDIIFLHDEFKKRLVWDSLIDQGMFIVRELLLRSWSVVYETG